MKEQVAQAKHKADFLWHVIPHVVSWHVDPKNDKTETHFAEWTAVGKHVVPLLALALRYHEMETSSWDYFYLNQVLAISVAEGHSFLIYFSKKKDHISIFFFNAVKEKEK